MVESRTPEQQLLVSCVRAYVHSQPVNDADIELGSQEFWETFLVIARRHHLQPVIFCALQSALNLEVPADVLSAFRESARRLAIRNIALTFKLQKIIGKLEEEEIFTVPFKGPVYAQSVYGDLSMRKFGDLDLLVKEQNFARASAALTNLGFELVIDTHWERHYLHKEEGVAVDLHRRLTPRFLPLKGDLDELLSEGSSLLIAGAELRTLSLEDSIIIHCAHLVKDCWDVQSGFRERVRLNKLCDVAVGLKHKDLDMAHLLGRASKMRAERMLLFGMSLVQAVLSLEPPSSLSAKVATNPLLASFPGPAEHWFFGGARTSGASGILFEMRAKDKLEDRFLLFVKPTKEDESSLALPKTLYFLYFFIRPFRLLAVYAGGWLRSRSDRGF